MKLYTNQCTPDKISVRFCVEVIAVQCLMTIAIPTIASFSMDFPYTKSVAWGGLCAVISSGLLLWQMLRNKYSVFHAKKQLGIMYRSILERFFIVFCLLLLGLLKLKLDALMLLLGFVSGQLTLVLTYIIFGLRKKAE